MSETAHSSEICCVHTAREKISSVLQGSFAKETYNFKEPTNHSHPIFEVWPLRYAPCLCLLYRDSFICETWLGLTCHMHMWETTLEIRPLPVHALPWFIHMWDMTRTHKSCVYVCIYTRKHMLYRDSFIYETWRGLTSHVCMCVYTHANTCCTVIHSYMRHDADSQVMCICVYIHTQTHAVPWFIHIWDMTRTHKSYPYVRYDSRICSMSHSYEQHPSFCEPTSIHMFDRLFSLYRDSRCVDVHLWTSQGERPPYEVWPVAPSLWNVGFVRLYARHDSFVCMQDMSYSYSGITRGAAMARYVTCLYVWETWLIRVYARYVLFIWWYHPWCGYGEICDLFVCVGDMTHSCVCKICLIHIDMSYSYMVVSPVLSIYE